MARHRQERPETEIVSVPAQYVNLALRRTDAIVKHWTFRGDLELKKLIAAIYLQGVSDGFDACEAQNKKEQGA